MKRTFLPLLLTLVLVMFSGCGNDATVDGIKMPFSSVVCKGENYKEILSDLSEAGFTNVNTEIIDDLVTGWKTKDGEVEQVSVDGDSSYDPEARYPTDVKIIVSYHTFPKDENSNESGEQPSSSEPVIETPEEEDIITIENNKELAAVMTVSDEYDSTIGKFVEKYKGRTIEFDGCLILVSNHDNYDTRYDILLSAGNYVDENTTNPGPLFKMNDVNTTDMGIKDLFLPEFISIGKNIHVTAKIIEHDKDSGLFIIDPVLVEER